MLIAPPVEKRCTYELLTITMYESGIFLGRMAARLSGLKIILRRDESILHAIITYPIHTSAQSGGYYTTLTGFLFLSKHLLLFFPL